MAEERSTEKKNKKSTERQTLELSSDRMANLIRKATPQNARDTLPVEHPPHELLEETSEEKDSPKRRIPIPATEASTEPGLYISMGGDKIVWVEGEKKILSKKKKSTQIFG
ncbi:MAG: hypothetical protein JXX29_10550 [Deltaproteobacteria bacterium]|nr:hypothetical protein [Deltaproteobacteria bacterium]MBN2672107.1 hypothetical protein [Deltaproteobacteria bacterium]